MRAFRQHVCTCVRVCVCARMRVHACACARVRAHAHGRTGVRLWACACSSTRSDYWSANRTVVVRPRQPLNPQFPPNARCQTPCSAASGVAVAGVTARCQRHLYVVMT
jgi:hypothetical protein